MEQSRLKQQQMQVLLVTCKFDGSSKVKAVDAVIDSDIIEDECL